MKVQVTVCDVCGEVGRETTAYKIQRDGETGRQVTVDLCARHAAPLEAFLTKRREATAPEPSASVTRTAARRRRPTTIKATSLEEIEEMKRKGGNR
jgi:hypothetical protein